MRQETRRAEDALGRYNYRSDFALTFAADSELAVKASYFSVAFRLTFRVDGGGSVSYVATWDGASAWKNCARGDDGSLTVYFDAHGLSCGWLLVDVETATADSHYESDNTYNEVTTYDPNVLLWAGATELSDGQLQCLKLIEKGDKGDAATITVGETSTGDPGTKAVVVNRGTEHAAILDFVVPKGDPFTYSDFTEEQIKGLQKPATDAAALAEDKAELADTAAKAADDARTNVNAAIELATEVAVHPDVIGADGYWHHWNTEMDIYEKTDNFGLGGFLLEMSIDYSGDPALVCRYSPDFGAFEADYDTGELVYKYD